MPVYLGRWFLNESKVFILPPRNCFCMVEELKVHTELLDSSDWEYVLGGMLVGTEWLFPKLGEEVVEEVRKTSETVEGEKVEYVELVLKWSGRRMAVSSFLRRIDSNDIGDVKPSSSESSKIRFIQEEYSWRNVSAFVEE